MRLLLAVDVNDGAEELIGAARKWAEALGGKIDLLYVDEHSYDAYLVQDPAVRTVLDREWEKVREHQRQRLEALRSQLPEAIRGEAEVRVGRAAVEIAEAGKTRDAVMISTHGRRGLSHALLGSVAERVVRSATVPVVVLRWAA